MSINWGMGEPSDSFFSFGFISSIISKIVTAIKEVLEKRVYTCSQCGTTGVLHYQFYKIEKFVGSSQYEIKCKKCYAVIRTIDKTCH